MKQIAVVSLVDEHTRRAHIDHLFSEHHLDFSYFDAINKSQVEQVVDKYGLSLQSDKISKGEAACYLSHYCLWKQVVENKLAYLMIFEDDIHFSKNTKDILNNLEWLPTNFDVIKLETIRQNVMIRRGSKLLPTHRLCRIRSEHLGSGGYIISYQGAKKLLNMTLQFGLDRPVDRLLFDELICKKNGKVYQVLPAICIQEIVYDSQSIRFKSSLEVERSKPIVKIEKTVDYTKTQKMKREVLRLKKQMLNIFSTTIFLFKGYKKQTIDYEK